MSTLKATWYLLLLGLTATFVVYILLVLWYLSGAIWRMAFG